MTNTVIPTGAKRSGGTCFRTSLWESIKFDNPTKSLDRKDREGRKETPRNR
jgi:hypothetical protein